jgi:hypothetical protein
MGIMIKYAKTNNMGDNVRVRNASGLSGIAINIYPMMRTIIPKVKIRKLIRVKGNLKCISCSFLFALAIFVGSVLVRAKFNRYRWLLQQISLLNNIRGITGWIKF